MNKYANYDASQYPRPQMVRDGYQPLDGCWDYKIIKGTLSDISLESFEPDGKIQVPFAPESALSGVNRTLSPDELLIYRTTFERMQKDKIALLHFGAVDYQCRIFVNGKSAGEHIGGYTSFEIDVTDLLQDGNTLTVIVADPSDTRPISRGKQKIKHGGIWYTPASGIWQSVWLEYVPRRYVRSIKIIPDLDSGSVNISVDTNDSSDERFQLTLQGKTYIGDRSIDVKPDVVIPWTPENPYLYEFRINYGQDEIKSYFAMRKFSVGKREDGKPCFMLNNEPYFMRGLLDQGYWSEGLYTAPNDQALIDDIMLAKECGFNTLRKHIKIEPMRWYYHCDRLGMIVWQDFVNGGGKYNPLAILILPNLGIHVKDSRYSFYSRSDETGRQLYYKEMNETVNQLFNCPCIALWTPFNEGWGQFDSLSVCDYLKSLDSTRLIDHASGWSDQGGEIRSIHKYFVPFKMPKKESRPVILSEFGGYSMRVENHSFSDKIFGYAKFNDRNALNSAIKKLWQEQLIPAKRQGLCAAIYTQLSDVQCEVNGLITYDRMQIKIDKAMLAKLNFELIKS